MSESKPFTLDGNRFDLSTYVGRCRHFFEMFNPLLLFTTDKQLEEARILLEKFKRKEITIEDAKKSPQLNEQLWESKKIRDAIIHPQTNEKIPLPFRMSAFVPMNLPTALGMLLSNSQAAGLFWQWYNQSYNVALNFANGNKTNPMPASKIAQAYTIAVTSSFSVHYGLNRLLANSKSFGVTTRSIITKTIPFTAVASAGALNVFFMRYNEISEGIEVCDENGNKIGISKIAGQRAILQTALSRIVLPAPILLFPPIVLKGLESTKFVKARPKLMVPLNLVVITGFLWGALPCAVGLFQQMSPISPKRLEPEFHDVEYDTLWYNKGL